MIWRKVFLLPALSITPLYAEETVSTVEDISLLQVVMPLLLVITLIFLLAWLVKKVNSGVSALGRGVTVIGNAPLSSQARVCLVASGNKTFLLGVTSQQVTLLEKFDESPVSPPKDNPQNFAGEFKRLLKRSDQPANNSDQD